MMTTRLNRALRVTGVALSLGAGSLLLASCGGSSSADALGHQACGDVKRSISTYKEAATAATPAVAAKDRSKALDILREALQPASLAGSQDGDWQALMTTLSESSRVKESLLITALQAQCSFNS